MLINTAICDDHPLVSLALKTVLRGDPEFNIVGEPASGPELIKLLREQRCDLVILDYSMPGELDGIALIQYLSRMFPDTRLLVFSGIASAALASRCIEAGANGFMRKTQSGDLLREAVRSVAQGSLYIDPSLQGDYKRASGFEQAFLSLSPREMVVVRLLLAGQSVSEISARLNRSIKTVSTQKQTAYRKLNIQSDAELFRLAGDLGVADGSAADPSP
ncbi:MAG: response regulator transcription factor [Paludibacterium sp.]|uniref:response regulator transcription factor n=1 Tax=Paludibacterium sp. TaxID=1917523 RepID=UPI0025D1D53A|nr:response regulator transcription factor [Paludibacterium sp.]MBV8049059.1 response regulator transcription factor [Paludibacterium sp.]MBV8649087.1 response regulator transcription factor [Paludibacterium sp.]